MMAVSVLSLLLLAVILLTGLAGLIVLLVNPRTRLLGFLLLGAALLMPVLLGFLFFARVKSTPPPHVVLLTPRAAAQPLPTVQPTGPMAKTGPIAHVNNAPAQTPRQTSSLLDAIRQAVVDSFTPNHKTPLATSVFKAPGSKPSPPAAKPAEPRAEDRPVAARRPEWVDAAPKNVDSAYYVATKVGPYTTRLECDGALPEAVRATAAEYVGLWLGAEAAGDIRLPADDLQLRLVRELWEEPVPSSFGPMVELHAQLVFDAKAREWFKDEWNRAVALRRMRVAAVGLASVLGLLGAAYLALKALGPGKTIS